jgi:hypothetical protein
MKRTALFCLLVLLLAALGSHVGAEELSSLTVTVSDFKFSGVSEGEMKEYVGYLLLQLERSLSQQIRANPLYLELMISRGPSEDHVPPTPPADEERAVKLRVSGTLKKAADGYKVAISIAEVEGGQGRQAFEYTYADVQQLYSDCGEVARRLAQACLNRPPEALEYKMAYGAGVFLGGGFRLLPATSEWAEYTTLGLTGFVLPRAYWGLGLDLSWTGDSLEGSSRYLMAADLRVILGILFSVGVDFAVSVTQEQSTPYLGFSLGFLEMPPIQFWGFGLLKMFFMWNLETGERFRIDRVFSLAIGISNLLVAGEPFVFGAPRPR